MATYKYSQNGKIEGKLSQLGAMVSLAADDLTAAEQKVMDAKVRLAIIQLEIEQIYMTLKEPFIYKID